MKLLFVGVFCLFSAALAFENVEFDGHRDIVDKLKVELAKPSGVSGVTAIINEYADRLLANLDRKISNSTLDPMDVPGYDQKFLGEQTKLSNGKLHGLSTLHRYKDCIINYQRTENLMTLTIPIQFNEIKFTYDYLIRVILISYKGGVEGKMTNFRMNYVFSLDLNIYHIAMKTSEITNSGHIDLTFKGHILDLIINLLSELFTTVLGPIIRTFIQVAFNTIINGVVKDINSAIEAIFNPTSTVASLLFNQGL